MLLNSFIQDLAQIYGQIVNFHQCVRKRQSFCQMQRLTNQRAKLTVEFTAKLFWVISIIASVMHTKNRIGFATDCKSDPVFQFETEFFQSHVCALYIIHSSLRSFQSQTARQESSSLTLISWKVVTVSTPVMVICA